MADRALRSFSFACLVALAGWALASAARADAGAGPLVVYCGRGEALVAQLLSHFEERTGTKLDVRYGATPTLAAQLRVEGDKSPADVFFAQECGALGALAEAGLLAPLPDDVLARVEPRFRDPGGRWVATSGRARVLVHDTKRVKPEELPRRLEDLADPKWKGRIGWAPGNASFQAHVSALRHAWGEARTRAWLEAVMKNEPKAYPRNGPIVQAVASGEVDLGWVNHYYLHRLRRPGWTLVNASFAEEGDIGNVLMISGVGVRAGSPRAGAAARLVSWLLSQDAQRYFAQETFEYPVATDVPTRQDVAPLASLRLATVDPVHLTDIEPTLELLRGLGLQ